MNTDHLQDLQSSLDAQTLGSTAASGKLARGRAVTLRPRVAGILRVPQGRAWATLDIAPHSPWADAGDHFVAPGHDLPVRAGQRVVVEAWPQGDAASISLEYQPVPALQGSSQWQAAVVEPVRELGHGLALAGYALGRLALGLVSYGERVLPGRWRGLQRL